MSNWIGSKWIDNKVTEYITRMKHECSRIWLVTKCGKISVKPHLKMFYTLPQIECKDQYFFT